MKKLFWAMAGMPLLIACGGQEAVVVTVTNPSDLARTGEMVEVSAEDIFRLLSLEDTSQIVIYNEKAEEVPYQFTYDDRIVFPVSVTAGGTVGYTIQAGTPALVNTAVYGRQYPEHGGDVAWENDRAAYRTFGSTGQESGEVPCGYDLLAKNTSELVLEERYALEQDAAVKARIKALKDAGEFRKADSLFRTVSCQVDHGNGMDCYAVGQTLGGGAAALMPDSVLVYPQGYVNCEIWDNGPLRFTVKLEYAPLTVKNDSGVTETRIVQLDKGSRLNKTTVSYEGLSDKTPLAAGIVVHRQHPDGYVFDERSGYIAYADSTETPCGENGVIYAGLVFPQSLAKAQVRWFKRPKGDALGHVLGINDYFPEDVCVYYWGMGWSKYGFPEESDWTGYLKDFAEKVRYPLKVEVR